MDLALVDEDVLTTVSRGNKAESLLGIKPFAGSIQALSATVRSTHSHI
jgi:hypothetical protein